MKKMVTFMSDFGTGDAYVAQVKARILSAHSDAVVVDITHDVASYAVCSGAWLLFTTYAYFPEGTVHLCIVDPGVGTDRRILIVKKAGHFFVGPDNGVFSFIYPADEVIEVTWRPDGAVSPTFHGRDIFAPVAVKVLDDPLCTNLGNELKEPVMFDVQSPMVVHIDKFGNVVTNIPCSVLKQLTSLVCSGMRVDGIAATYADIPEGRVCLVCGSANTIEIAANRKSAAEITGAYVGMPLLLDVQGSGT